MAAGAAQQGDRETTMNANHNVNFTSSIEQRLNSVNISRDRRQQVLHNAGIAEAIVDAVEWLCGKFKRPKGRRLRETQGPHVTRTLSHRTVTEGDRHEAY
jgi:hypothetical protein